MLTLLRGGLVHFRNTVRQTDIALYNDRIVAVSDDLDITQFDCVKNLFGLHVFPGFVDVHVHLREPGFFYKESIYTGTMAAARGGYTSVFSMPNLDPVPDCLDNLKVQLDIISQDAVVSVYPYGSITIGQKGSGQLSAMEEMSSYVKGFSDDGKGIQGTLLMKKAMLEAKRLNQIIVAHCEDESALEQGGSINKGNYSTLNNMPGISSQSEYKQLARDIELLKETGCRYHMCHVSCKESVSLLRKAKDEGVDITAETGPHYLMLSEDDLKDEGCFKMNPPLRTQEDKRALIHGVLDGTIDMIATDHAPHSLLEKSKGLLGSSFGIVGLEIAFQLMYTSFVRTGIMSIEVLLDRMVYAPCARFKLQTGIEPGKQANLTVWDLDRKTSIDSRSFLSKGKATPFEGREIFGHCLLTICEGRVAYEV